MRRLFQQSFPLAQRFFSPSTPDVWVAEHKDKLIGAVTLKTYPLSAGRKGGIISWIFTTPKARGLGAGQRRVKVALDHFNSPDCQEITACVEGYSQLQQTFQQPGLFPAFNRNPAVPYLVPHLSPSGYRPFFMGFSTRRATRQFLILEPPSVRAFLFLFESLVSLNYTSYCEEFSNEHSNL